MKKIRILVLSDEVWNDKIHGNNVLTNWFEGFEGEFANVYCSPGKPNNNCCKKYFQITDTMMVKSILGKGTAGESFELNSSVDENKLDGENENKKLYSNLKSVTTESLRAIRELIWNYGKYDLEGLGNFIADFQPDIIFSPRMATIKILRLEKIVSDIANVPIVAFTGDAEYSMRLFRISPVFWVKKLILRRKLKQMMPNYSMYYTLSDEQKNEYTREFGNKFKILRKCGEFSENSEIIKKINKPIKLVYAGKLYSNRWKTLAEVAKAISLINKTELKMSLEIYTNDKVTKYQAKLLDDGVNSSIKKPVSPEELKDIYKKADIALHVESFDLKNRLLTRVSFSTKIIDCLASGCAVMAISWDKHSGYTYLSNEDAAITVGCKDDILKELIRISDNSELILEYSQKAKKCGQRNHQKQDVQKLLYDDFSNICNKN